MTRDDIIEYVIAVGKVSGWHRAIGEWLLTLPVHKLSDLAANHFGVPRKIVSIDELEAELPSTNSTDDFVAAFLRAATEVQVRDMLSCLEPRHLRSVLTFLDGRPEERQALKERDDAWWDLHFD